MTDRVAVLGGGAWGTALALAAARAGRDVLLWARSAATVTAINATHENSARLPGVRLPPAIAATDDLAAAVTDRVVLVVVPMQQTRSVVRAMAPNVAAGTPVVMCAKGLEAATRLRATEILAEEAPQALPAVLAGPSFATEVAAGLPTAVTIAAADDDLAARLCTLLAGPGFRPYAETDMIGVELGGAIKNVLAIAAGIVVGRRLGGSAQAALIARGFAEMQRLGLAAGAEAGTLIGLSGLGDLVLTCTSGLSRNYAYGLCLGEGRPAGAALAEGVATAQAVVDLAEAAGVETPIAAAVAAIVAGRLDVDAAIADLMARPLRRERD